MVRRRRASGDSVSDMTCKLYTEMRLDSHVKALVSCRLLVGAVFLPVDRVLTASHGAVLGKLPEIDCLERVP